MPEKIDSFRSRGGKELWLHRFALLTAGATFPLLFIGGLVTSKGAGLAVPDWPTTFGYSMFLYPWSKMIGGIFYEHSHRLVASLVGLLTLALALWLWRGERRRWLRWLGMIALALVIVQGMIGGLRVVLLEETLAIIHACFAQAFFALTVSLAFFTSKEGREGVEKIWAADSARIRRLCILTTGIIYLQGFFGAILRHTGARLEIHLVLAAVVTLHVVFLAIRIFAIPSDPPKLLRPAILLLALLVLQISLGFGAYMGRFTALGKALPLVFVVIIRTAHVVTGALMLATSVVITLRCYRVLASSEIWRPQRVLSERITA
ncbi:MAG: COX15/CtaA family protein [Deltaproteobacteria bacterium]|nr:COX15/CtaA family protein [Deltaproteobacteria bacterium]